MLDIKFKLDAKSKRLINSLDDKFEDGISKVLVRAMLFAEGEAKQIFKEGGPVRKPPGPLVARTGHLRRSIRSGVSGNTGWIGTEVIYGKYNEPTRPFLRPSFEGGNLTKIRKIISDGIYKEFK